MTHWIVGSSNTMCKNIKKAPVKFGTKATLYESYAINWNGSADTMKEQFNEPI